MENSPTNHQEIYIEVDHVEFIDALTGETFVETENLMRVNNYKKTVFDVIDYANIDDITTSIGEFVVLKNARLGSGGSLWVGNDLVIKHSISIIFYKCQISQVLIVNNGIRNLHFIDCHAPDFFFSAGNGSNIDRVTINNCSMERIAILPGASIESIAIEKSSVDFVGFQNQSKLASFKTSDSNLLEIEIDPEAVVDSLALHRGSCDDLSIEHGKCNKILLSNCLLRNLSALYDAEIKTLQLVSGAVLGKIHIRDASVHDITASGSSICGYLWVVNNKIPARLKITDDAKLGAMECSSANFSQIHVIGCTIGLELTSSQIFSAVFRDCRILYLLWKEGTSGELTVTGSYILYLMIQHTVVHKDSIIVIDGCQARFFILHKVLFQGKLLLRNVFADNGKNNWPIQIDFMEPLFPNIKVLAKAFDFVRMYTMRSMIRVTASCSGLYEHVFDDFRKQHEKYKDEKRLSPHEEYVPSYYTDHPELDTVLHAYNELPPMFRMSFTSMGTTEFTDCHLEGFNLQYVNSNLMDCFISGTVFFNRSEDVYIYRLHGINNLKYFRPYEQEANFYTQLKKIYEKQGDIVEANWYHAKAMASQQKVLQFHLTHRSTRQGRKRIMQEVFDLIAFWLNKVSNNHGENWGRALLFLFISSSVLYSLYFISIHHAESFSWAGSDRFIGDYLSFLDFTHRIDFHVPKDQLSALSKFIDYFGKVAIGYGLFQLVAAFRKHGKKIS